MSHVVDKELFARIEKRWNKVVLDKDIDPALREILPHVKAELATLGLPHG